MRQRRSVVLVCVALVLGFALTARAWDESELSQKMKQAQKLEKSVQKSIAGDRKPIAAADASKLAALFDEVEDFWERKGIESAQESARDVAVRTRAVASLVEKGDFDNAKLAAKNMNGSCQGCHAAYSVETK